MTTQILHAGILPSVSFSIGGSSQQISYDIGVNPVTVPQDVDHVLKIILQILSPSSFVIYQNAGWNSSSFTSPDSLTGQYPLPLLTGFPIPESGEYKINIQAQYVDSTGAPVTTNATVNYVSEAVCVSCLPGASLSPVQDCTNVLLTITDVTAYALQGFSWIGTTRTITAIPPTVSSQPTATGTAKVLQIDNGSEGNGILWNGTYTLSLTATAIYEKGTTTIVQTLQTTQIFTVACVDGTCKLYCALDTLNTKAIELLTENPPLAITYLQRLANGASELVLINSAIACGGDYSKYIPNFWKVTQLDENCTCCTAIVPSGPVKPVGGGSGGGSNGLPGPPGLAGSQWRVASGVPSDGLGVNSDLYLNSANGDVYQKVDGAYVLKLNIKGSKGDTGDPGDAGANGTDGTTLLWAPVGPPPSGNVGTIPYSNTGTGVGDAVTRTIPRGTFVNQGDTVSIIASVACATFKTMYFMVTANATTSGGVVGAFVATNDIYAEIEWSITLSDTTHILINGTTRYYDQTTNKELYVEDQRFDPVTMNYTIGTDVVITANFSAINVAGEGGLLRLVAEWLKVKV